MVPCTTLHLVKSVSGLGEKGASEDCFHTQNPTVQVLTKIQKKKKIKRNNICWSCTFLIFGILSWHLFISISLNFYNLRAAGGAIGWRGLQTKVWSPHHIIQGVKKIIKFPKTNITQHFFFFWYYWNLLQLTVFLTKQIIKGRRKTGKNVIQFYRKSVILWVADRHCRFCLYFLGAQ